MTSSMLNPSTNPSSSDPGNFKSSHSRSLSSLHPTQKLGTSVSRKSASFKNPKLTQEALENFNKKTGDSSPYYKGLIDYSLILSRERFSGTRASSGGESRASSGWSSSKTGFVGTMRRWFRSLGGEEEEETMGVPNTRNNRSSSSSSSSSVGRSTTLAKELGMDKNKKPLRERLSKPPPTSIPPVSSPPPARPLTEQLLPSPPVPQKVSSQLPVIPPSGRQLVAEQALSPLSPVSVIPAQPQESSTNRMTENVGTSKATERAYVWADQYRPKALKDFICNKNKALELQEWAKEENCRHFIFEGAPGVGKKSMIWALLREAYGPDRVQEESCGSIEVTVKISLQHVEVNLAEVKGYERHVIVELIQENNMLPTKATKCNKDNCRVIILHKADKLPTDTLLYLKWQLERHKGCYKVFFCCSDASKLQPITSLCTLVKLNPPSNEELAETIAKNSQHNLRQAIRSLEATWRASSPLKEDKAVMTGWEDDIANVAKNIVAEQSPKQLYLIRGKLQNLVEHTISPKFIFEALVGELKKHSPEEFQPQIQRLYEDYTV
ncbi:hypothetical protein NMG60_11023241 [Bertholletia excelsa]